MTDRPIIKPHPGPQERFLASRAFEALYGGAAGGGKSWGLMLGALRHTDKPHYAGLLLRRTVPELHRAGGLVDKSFQVYPAVGGVPHEGGRRWSFPSGARIEFASMELEQDRFKYQSTEYQFIGFDELTTFTETQYVFMISRLRSPHGIPLAMRGATNPGGLGHDWVLKRFAPWLYPVNDNAEYDGPRASPGARLWFRRDEAAGEEVLCARDWFDSECLECLECSPSAACENHRPRDRVFFPARIEDNPSLKGTGYAGQLDQLDKLSRLRLRDGDWMARPVAGMLFQRGWFEIVDAAPALVAARVRYWDRAATPKTSTNNPDWTAGVRMSRSSQGLYFVEHVSRFRGDPLLVEGAIVGCSETDPAGCYHVIEHDPGQAGVFEAKYYSRALAGKLFKAIRPQGDKIARLRPLSAQAEAGNVKIVRGPWNEIYLRELESLPEGKKDQGDGSSGAFAHLTLTNTGRSTSGGQVREMTKRVGGF